MYGGFSLQVILQTLLIKAEEKLKNGENIIREHENIDATMAVSKTVKDKHLKKKLQLPVTIIIFMLIFGLKGLTKAGRHPGRATKLGPAGPGGEPGVGSEGHHQEGEGAGDRTGSPGLLKSEGGHEPDTQHPTVPQLTAGRVRPLPAHLGENQHVIKQQSYWWSIDR